jgi:hypothetical protein
MAQGGRNEAGDNHYQSLFLCPLFQQGQGLKQGLWLLEQEVRSRHSTPLGQPGVKLLGQVDEGDELLLMLGFGRDLGHN